MELERIKAAISDFYPYRIHGKVEQVVGLVIEGRGPISSIGDSAQIFPFGEGEPIEAEVVGFRDGKTLLMPLGDTRGIGVGSKIVTRKQSVFYYAGETLLGRVIDGLGNPIDGKGEIKGREPVPIYRRTVNPMRKKMITEPLDVGIRSINGLLTCGKGQRVGIFAGSGVGKSVLLGMIARHTSADVNVIALIGERGREVKEFIER
ncbi:MAG: flagellum-specific ATP synthase FliI, partial [Deltaproteobacteria bacterium]|nr:flagellum-specific ATP synthase FliI [Deltaproteobacteria bacterium]